MAKLSDRVAYLKGLAEGMNLTEDTQEHKFLLKILEALEAFSEAVDELRSGQEEIDEYLGDLDEDLSSVEDAVFGEDEDEAEDEDGGECPGSCTHPSVSDGDGFVEYECPFCGYKTKLDITDFDFEEDYLCPRCNKPFFPESEEDEGDEEGGEEGGAGAEKS